MTSWSLISAAKMGWRSNLVGRSLVRCTSGRSWRSRYMMPRWRGLRRGPHAHRQSSKPLVMDPVLVAHRTRPEVLRLTVAPSGNDVIVMLYGHTTVHHKAPVMRELRSELMDPTAEVGQVTLFAQRTDLVELMVTAVTGGAATLAAEQVIAAVTRVLERRCHDNGEDWREDEGYR